MKYVTRVDSKLFCLVGMVFLSSVCTASSMVAPELLLPECPHRHDAKVVGAVSSMDDSEHLYCEYHIGQVLTPQESSSGAVESWLVLYELEGVVFARKSVLYSQQPYQPQIEQIDNRSGERRVAQRQADTWQIEYRKNEHAKVKTGREKLGSNGVVDAGFNRFVKSNWETLQNGERLVVDFLSIPHRRAIELQIARASCALSRPLETVCFRVRVNNAFLRLVTGELNLEYNDKKQLVRFSGVVNIQDNEEDTQKAVAQYAYF